MTPTTGIVRGMPEHVYHSDPCDEPSLSSSIAKVIWADSLAHAYVAHPKLGGEKQEPKDAYDKGAVIHKLLLGRGAAIDVHDFDAWRSNVAKAAKQASRDAGAVPILKHKYDELADAFEPIKARMEGMDRHFPAPAEEDYDPSCSDWGDTEVTLFWVQDGVQCRARLDSLHVGEKRITIRDFKSSKSANPDDCGKTICDYGYDVQRAAYISAVEHVFPDYVGRVDFEWIFAELKSPHAVTPVRASESIAHMGMQKWRQSLALWKDALERDEWPAYVTESVVVDAPYWELKRFYEVDESE